MHDQSAANADAGALQDWTVAWLNCWGGVLSAWVDSVAQPSTTAASVETSAAPASSSNSVSVPVPRGQSSATWYRPPVETPFGDWMAGSGQFVPSDALTSLAMTAWQPFAGLTSNLMRPSGPFGFAMSPWWLGVPSSLHAWPMAAWAMPSVWELWSGMLAPQSASPAARWASEFGRLASETQQQVLSATWPGKDSSAETVSTPQPLAEDRPASANGFVSHRSASGHAVAQVIRGDDSGTGLTMLVPLALLAVTLGSWLAGPTAT